MKYINFLALFLVFFLCSCGHNITHTDRGTGLALRIPLPDGSSLIDLKIGKIDSTTTVLRGGATYDASASTGGSMLGPMGTSDRIQVSTVPQINQGYVAQVLTSKDTPAEVKIALTKYLVEQKAPTPLPTATKTIGAASTTDLKQPVANPATTGWDKVTETAGEAIPKIVPPVTDAAKEMTKSATEMVSTSVKEVAEATENSVKQVSDASESWVKNIKWIVVIAGICFIIIAGIIVYFLIKRKKKSITEKVVQQVVEKTISE